MGVSPTVWVIEEWIDEARRAELAQKESMLDEDMRQRIVCGVQVALMSIFLMCCDARVSHAAIHGLILTSSPCSNRNWADDFLLMCLRTYDLVLS
jgi:hypothetical protein